MQERIQNAFINTISSTVKSTITGMVEREFGEQIRSASREAINTLIIQKVKEFMERPIQVGGGWREEARSVPRDQYLSELIEKSLAEKFQKEKLADEISAAVNSKVSGYMKGVRLEADRAIQTVFDDVTRTNLTDAIVDMLMSNETYQKLKGSMQNLIAGASS